jgi:peroxiredoxin
MPIGAHIPDFTLPGADLKTHSLSEWAGAKFPAIVFECNRCPVSQIYGERIKKLNEARISLTQRRIVIEPYSR